METNVLVAMQRCFGAVRLDPDPYPHFALAPALDEDTAADLLVWFSTKARWRLQTSHFYNQMACSNLCDGFSGRLQEALGPAGVNALRERMSELFGTEMSARHVVLSAHRLTAGQGIGLHTDRPDGETETHRLVMHFNDSFEDPFGGHLILFGSNDSSDIRRIVRPIHNSAAGFALSERSFHAVNDVAEGTRYSLVFSFWEAGREPNARPSRAAHRHDGQVDEELDPLTDFLTLSGASNIGHSDRTLLDHLVGVYRILSQWGCDADTRKAGLFHSVYGTRGFPKALFGTDRRQEVVKRIGERSEQLAFFFGQLLPRQLFEGDVQADTELRLAEGGTVMINGSDRRALLALFWANTLEQLPHAAADVVVTEAADVWLRTSAPALTATALAELSAAYARKAAHA